MKIYEAGQRMMSLQCEWQRSRSMIKGLFSLVWHCVWQNYELEIGRLHRLNNHLSEMELPFYVFEYREGSFIPLINIIEHLN